MSWQQRNTGPKPLEAKDYAMFSQNALNAAVATAQLEMELAKITGEVTFNTEHRDGVSDRVLVLQDLYYGLHMKRVGGDVQAATATVVRQMPGSEPDTSSVTTIDQTGGSFVIEFGGHKGKTLAEVYEENESYVRNFLAKSMEPKNDVGRQAQAAARVFIDAVDAAA